jgi:hypothetical protein
MPLNGSSTGCAETEEKTEFEIGSREIDICNGL